LSVRNLDTFDDVFGYRVSMAAKKGAIFAARWPRGGKPFR